LLCRTLSRPSFTLILILPHHVIDALFNADLATDENLTILFGDSSIVSNTTFDLQVAKLEANQKKLADFWPKKRRRTLKV
jgi:hypothetical protein